MIFIVHLMIIVFNVAGLLVIPVGACAGWEFVRKFWLRLLHVGLLAIVAIQAMMGRACILTIWQSQLSGSNQAPPLLMHWAEKIIYWQLPLWVFAVIYVLVFLYVMLLWFLIPPHPPRRRI